MVRGRWYLAANDSSRKLESAPESIKATVSMGIGEVEDDNQTLIKNLSLIFVDLISPKSSDWEERIEVMAASPRSSTDGTGPFLFPLLLVSFWGNHSLGDRRCRNRRTGLEPFWIGNVVVGERV